MSCPSCHFITGHDPGCRHHAENLQQDSDDLRARIESLETRLDRLDKIVLDYAHLKKLYDESRDYVGTLERERDDLVAASSRGVAEQNRLDALIERMRPVYEAAKRMRASVPVETAAQMRERGFHATTCDLVEVVDRAAASEAAESPYRGAL